MSRHRGATSTNKPSSLYFAKMDTTYTIFGIRPVATI